jgi:hypothetical protein
MIDSRKMEELHMTLQQAFAELKNRVKRALDIDIMITSTYRDFEYQDYLYSIGRTIEKNKPIVTNAKGGESIHNYRLAFDFAPLESNGSIDWSSKNKKWRLTGELWEGMGGVWGGNFISLVDLGHCEYTGGLKLTDLKNGSKLTKKMIWEVKLEEKIKELEKEIIRLKPKVYNCLEEAPEWAAGTISKLIKNKALVGDGNNLNLSEEAIRVLVINDRLGVYK